MDANQAVSLFEQNWFLRHVEKLDLTGAERQFISAAMGPAPKRWDGEPDVRRMTEMLAAAPAVLDRIGARLVTVLIGMRGCGPAVAFLLEQGVPLEIDRTSYNVLHEAAWGGMVDTLQAVFQSGAADATCVLGREAARGVAGSPVAHVLGRRGRIPRMRRTPYSARRRRSP